MKTSWKWLNAWVDLSGLKPEEVAERLTLAGLESEGIERLGEGMDDILVGRIETIKPHPKADRLVICLVDVGGGTPHQIVCGAKNMAEGDKVPVALPGSMPSSFDFEITEREMRGVMSHGMLCGGDEIGLDDGVDGLLILPPESPIGAPVFEALDLKDVVLHWGVTPNRPDCLSHRGVAREIAALFDRALRDIPTHTIPSMPDTTRGEHDPVARLAALKVEDFQGCPRYALAVIEGVEVVQSPAWLKARLQSIGVRAINAVVDATNFINFDIGQPLHAFDLDQLEGHQIVVRRAREGEELCGINQKSYELERSDLVIADAQRPVALAGVMGGLASGVTATTKRVLLECAYFDPTTVRKSAKRRGLHTDSSHRFERGIDAGATLDNLEYAVVLLMSLLGASARRSPGHLYAEEIFVQPHGVTLPVEQVSNLLGIELKPARIEQVLNSIDIKTTRDEAKGSIACLIPTWRPDLERPVDLIEEVARLIGFEAIPARLPVTVMGAGGALRQGEGGERRHDETISSGERRRALRSVRDQMLARGFYEAVNFSFMSEAELSALRLVPDDPLRRARALRNPMSQDIALMRTTLLPGLLRNLELNVAQRREDVALFEIGRRYLSDGSEPLTLAGVCSGRRTRHWSGDARWDFYDLKGLVEALALSRALPDLSWRAPEQGASLSYHPGVHAVWVDAQRAERVWARVARLHPEIERERGLTEVLVFELDLERLLELEPKSARFNEVSKFPAVTRDFALVQDRGEPYSRLAGALTKARGEHALLGELFEGVRVFDVYEGERLEEGKRSVALQVTLRASDRTLTEEEIEAVSEALIEAFEGEGGARLRS